MDQEKTGRFIAQVRKEKHLTQQNLAERMNISDKTISKWENGKSMPDISYLNELCAILDITVSELLNGERIAETDYTAKTDETIIELMKDRKAEEQQRKGVFVTGVVLCVLTFGLMLLMITLSLPSGFSWIAIYVDIPGIFVFALLSFAMMLIAGKKTKWEALCFFNRIVLCVGMIIMLVGLIPVFVTEPGISTEKICRSFAISVLPFFYSVIVKLFLSVYLEWKK